jgi:hypothetical protein
MTLTYGYAFGVELTGEEGATWGLMIWDLGLWHGVVVLAGLSCCSTALQGTACF